MKYYGKLTAAAAAGFMALSTMGVSPVFAATAEKIPFTVNVSLNNHNGTAYVPDVNVPAPATTITLTVTAGGEANLEDTTYNVYKDGDVNKVAISGGESVTGSNGSYTVTLSKNGNKATANLALSISGNFAANKPGVYTYTITQTATNTVEGVNLGDDDNSYTLSVYVDNEGNVMGYVIYDKDGHKQSSSEAEEVGTFAFNADYNTHSLTIEKNAFGNQMIGSDTYKFDVTVTPSTAGENFSIVKANGNSSTFTTEETDNLANDKSFTVYGLTSSDSVNIQEAATSDKNQTGYYTSVTNAEVTSPVTTNERSATVTSFTENQKRVFNNYKNGDVPTGIFMTAAPYAGLVALGGIFAGLFFRRKRED